MSAPWLSILIPVYNVESYLIECLDSIVKQASTDIEIIALNDCSTDNSLALLEEYCKRASVPIHIMQHEKNRGLSAARNTMLDAVQGDYVWFIDSDDFVLTGAIKELKKIVDSHSPDLIMCDFRILREKQTAKHRLRGENHVASFSGIPYKLQDDAITLFHGLYESRNLHIWSKISKKGLWGNDLRFPEGRAMEDMVVTPQLALKATTYFYQPSPWIAYRQREGSIMSTMNVKTLNDYSQGNDGVLKSWLARHPHMPDKVVFTFVNYCVKTYLGIMKQVAKQPEIKDTSIFRNRFLTQIHWPLPRVYWEYIKRGWWFRALKFFVQY